VGDKRVLLLATTTGYQIRSFGDAAEKLGVRLVFATDRCERLDDPWWDQAIPVRFHAEEQSLRAVVTGIDGDVPAGILAVGDRPTVLAAKVAEAWHLPGHPPDAASASRNKLAFRGVLRGAGLPHPWFVAVPLNDDPAERARHLQFPCIVKPMMLSGSRGVIRANDEHEFVAAFNRVKALLNSLDVRVERDPDADRLLIEGFIPGREFAVEGLLTSGTLRVLAVFDKPDPLDGPFFEETIYVTPPALTADDTQRIEAAIRGAVEALGLEHGPVHAECRMNEDGVFVLEVAARPIGGLCSRALRFWGPDPMSLEELLLRHAIGEDVSVYARESVASGVMMIPIPRRGVFKRVDGIEEARAVPHVDDVQVTVKADQLLVPLPEGKSYLGFIFARAATADLVVDALRQAHARLTFHIDRSLI
jgi:biotin carboxylase